MTRVALAIEVIWAVVSDFNDFSQEAGWNGRSSKMKPHFIVG